VAGLFVDLEDNQIPLMFRLLPNELAAETFVEMEPEDQEMLIRIAACMPLYKCDTFEDTLENACYVCNVEKESLSEEDLDFLEEMYEEEE
jgi:hypothetical protein